MKQADLPCAWPQSPSLCVWAAAPPFPFLASQRRLREPASTPTQTSWLQGAYSAEPQWIYSKAGEVTATPEIEKVQFRERKENPREASLCVGKVSLLEEAGSIEGFCNNCIQLAWCYICRIGQLAELFTNEPNLWAANTIRTFIYCINKLCNNYCYHSIIVD